MITYKVEVDDRGNRDWYNEDDQLHRLDGPAREWADGDKAWWVNGLRHRLDGPACEWANGSKFWYKSGQLHRLDGPAIERADGGRAWWIDGKRYTEEEFNEFINKPSEKDKKLVEIEEIKAHLKQLEDEIKNN